MGKALQAEVLSGTVKSKAKNAKENSSRERFQYKSQKITFLPEELSKAAIAQNERLSLVKEESGGARRRAQRLPHHEQQSVAQRLPITRERERERERQRKKSCRSWIQVVY